MNPSPKQGHWVTLPFCEYMYRLQNKTVLTSGQRWPEPWDRCNLSYAYVVPTRCKYGHGYYLQQEDADDLHLDNVTLQAMIHECGSIPTWSVDRPCEVCLQLSQTPLVLYGDAVRAIANRHVDAWPFYEWLYNENFSDHDRSVDVLLQAAEQQAHVHRSWRVPSRGVPHAYLFAQPVEAKAFNHSNEDEVDIVATLPPPPPNQPRPFPPVLSTFTPTLWFVSSHPS
jgi:hypothetical protein